MPDDLTPKEFLAKREEAAELLARAKATHDEAMAKLNAACPHDWQPVYEMYDSGWKCSLCGKRSRTKPKDAP